MISVIIPTYNRANIVSQTIDSFLKQTNQDFELIMVDDGSTDNTRQVVEVYLSDQVKYFQIPNGERGAARNYGATKAHGKFLNFFDSDDIALPNHIESAVQILKTNPDAKAFQLHVAYQKDNSTQTIQSPSVKKINELLLTGKYCFPNGVFIDKETFAKYRYNESRELSGTEDWDLYLRMVGEVDIWFYPTVTSYLVEHEGRSVLQFDEKALLKRYETLIGSISSSESFIGHHGNYLKTIKSRMLSYIALHAVLAKNKKVAYHYLRKAVNVRFAELFTQRTLAIFRRLLF